MPATSGSSAARADNHPSGPGRQGSRAAAHAPPSHRRRPVLISPPRNVFEHTAQCATPTSCGVHLRRPTRRHHVHVQDILRPLGRPRHTPHRPRDHRLGPRSSAASTAPINAPTASARPRPTPIGPTAEADEIQAPAIDLLLLTTGPQAPAHSVPAKLGGHRWRPRARQAATLRHIVGTAKVTPPAPTSAPVRQRKWHHQPRRQHRSDNDVQEPKQLRQQTRDATKASR
ncbi:hypothetical protein APR12_002385 [Nocardia amikacinitolerans]|nr:hypothetical protein [Nocardia amikacinitolerans]